MENFISFSAFSKEAKFPRDMGDGTFLLSSYAYTKSEHTYTFATGISVFVPENHVAYVTFSYPIQNIKFQDAYLSSGKWNILEFQVTSSKEENDVVVCAKNVMAPTLKIVHVSTIQKDLDY